MQKKQRITNSHNILNKVCSMSVTLLFAFSLLCSHVSFAQDTTKSKNNTTTNSLKKDSNQVHHRTSTISNTHNNLSKDSTKKKHTIAIQDTVRNSVNRNNITRSIASTSKPVDKRLIYSHKKNDILWEKITNIPQLPLKSNPIFILDTPHTFISKDALFFIISGLFLLYGIVRTAFPKYTNSLFRHLISFSSIDRNDTKMAQNNLPSLLLNMLFCLSVGLLAALIIEQIKDTKFDIWQLWLIGAVVLGAIYLIKFLTIYISGWIFNAVEDAGSYTYVVFLINKIIGIGCLPAILVFAFSENPMLQQYIVTIGSILLIVLLLYRYIVTFSVISRNLQLNAFHFFLYLCSVEIVPILILYKLFFKDLIRQI